MITLVKRGEPGVEIGHNKSRQGSKTRIAALVGVGAILAVGGLSMISLMPAERVSQHETYPVHDNITATVFWIGESADGSNDFIHNRSTAWTEDAVKAFGGIDDPNDRCGWEPCDFTPKENPFYVALPFGDHTSNGLRSSDELKVVPWHDGPLNQDESLLKNRWLRISKGDKTAFAQWEDVGPFEDDDPDYVFGEATPKESRAGIDLSPATADFLALDGRGQVKWQFVDDKAVPDGPWKKIVTTAPPQF